MDRLELKIIDEKNIEQIIDEVRLSKGAEKTQKMNELIEYLRRYQIRYGKQYTYTRRSKNS